MAEKDPDPTSRPGIPEALDPSLANGALWETEADNLPLKNIDPLKLLDTYLIDANTKLQIIDQWNGITEEAKPEVTEGSTPEITQITPEDIPAHDVGNEENVVPPESELKEFPESDVVEGSLSEEEESEVQPSPILEEEISSTEGESKVPEPEDKKVEKAGKRVRKVVKKARKERDTSAIKDLTHLPESEHPDTRLSPFTSWLKSLRGSEYIHPYEDDYGLGHLTGGPNAGVSETFAELLASQGYKEQAIDMYRQLIEKNPEKSSFFAAKIEALK